MKVKILSPEKNLFTGEVKMVEVPGSKGRFQMLNQHAPIVSTLIAGIIRIILPDDTEKLFNITGGVVELKQNTIVILAEQ